MTAGRCWCRCHVEALAQAAIAREAVAPEMQSPLITTYLHEAARDPGADVGDVIEAALACGRCRNAHCPALLERRIWGPRIVSRAPYTEQVPTATDQGEGAE